MNARPPASYLSKAEQVAQDLLARIIESKVEPGQSFATEAELLEQFDVSRPTLREGIRVLESQGVLGRRPGPGGGLVIRRPSLDMLAHTLSVFLRFNDVPFVTVLQAREVIEPALAAEAAERGTDEDFREMAESIERMKRQGDVDQAEFIAENRIFHGIVARASDNKVLETFWGTMSLLAHGEHHGMRYTFGNRQHVIAAHQKILDACRRRNTRAAAQAMAEHVGELEHLVRDRYQHLLKQPMSVRDHRGVR
jgi:GntR family transcriptional regulator, transcriptional repressor for pyruvate dehydrogenase complex